MLFPTPPLPETTAITRVFDSSLKAGASSAGPPCSEVIRFCLSSSVITPKSTSTLRTPSICMSLSLTSVVILCFIGHPAVVSATPTVTTPLSISTPAHHVERDEVPPYLRVPDVAQRLPYASLRETIRRLARRLVLRDAFLGGLASECRLVHLLIFTS